MKTGTLCTALGLLLAAVAVAGAADISGKWDAAVETSLGSGSPSFVFQQEGEKLSGDYSGALGTAKLQGTVKGDQVEFTFQADAGGESVSVTYQARLSADARKMEGTVRLGSLGDGKFTATKR